MQRGTRLSVDQVNQQILECIDLLSGNMEHVSIERLELMITQKYQVRDGLITIKLVIIIHFFSNKSQVLINLVFLLTKMLKMN